MKPTMTLLRALCCAALALTTAAAPAPITVHLIGDSTMANKPDPEHNPERGWGQNLQPFFDAGVVVRNYAVNGRSTKSFISEGRWDSVTASIHKGDYVLIEFGHNDEKSEDSTRYTNPYTGYRRNLERFVTESRAKGATAVVLSPIVRRHFNAQGVLTDTHGPYPWVAREVARDTHAPFIDLLQLTEDMVARLGPDRSKSLYVWTTEGQFPSFPQARQDDTHLNPHGATEVARLAARELKTIGGPLARHVVGID